MEIRGGVVPRLALPHRAPTPGYKRIDALPKTLNKMWSSPPPNSMMLPIRDSSNNGGMTHKTTVAKTSKVGSLTMTGTQTGAATSLPLTLTLLVALSPSFPPHSTPCSGHLSETPRNAQAVKKEKSPVKLSALKRTKVPVFRGKDGKKGSGEGEVLPLHLGPGVSGVGFRVSRPRVWLVRI